MKKTAIKVTAALVLSAILGGCGSNDAPELPADTIGLRVSAQIETGVRADKIAIIPNTTAGWTSQILLLSKGQVSRTSVDGGQSQAVNAGQVMDIIGLKRKTGAGAALTLTPDGTLRALKEKDDQGRLGRMNVSAKAVKYSGFCQHNTAPEDRLTLFSGKSLVTLAIAYKGNDVVTLEETSRTSLPKAITACVVNNESVYALSNGKIFKDGASVLTVNAAQSFSVLVSGKQDIVLAAGNGELTRTAVSLAQNTKKVLLEDGLSIRGSDQIGALHVSSDNLGGAFSKGILIFQDLKSDRLILISKSFASSELARQASGR